MHIPPFRMAAVFCAIIILIGRASAQTDAILPAAPDLANDVPASRTHGVLAPRSETVKVLGPGPVPGTESVLYTAFNGKTWPLVRFSGKYTALQFPQSWIDEFGVDTARKWADSADLYYQFMKEIVAGEPAGTGLLPISVIPDTCGGGCGQIGSKGIEMLDYYYNHDLWASGAKIGVAVTPIDHEMAHNFDIYAPYLWYLPDHGHAWVVFLSFYVHIYAQHYQPDGPPNVWAQSLLKYYYEPYISDPAYTWQTCQKNICALNSIGPWGSVTFRFAQIHGGEGIRRMGEFLRDYAASHTPPTTTEDKEDLHVEAMAYGAQMNLSCYVDYWKWYASPALRARMSSKYGAASGNCEDRDHDGYSAVAGDTDDSNPQVHPGATDIPNGIDDDGDGFVDNPTLIAPEGVHPPDLSPLGINSKVTATLAATVADGSLAAARFGSPIGLAFDPAGNLYVTDKDTHTVRRMNTNGTIITVAGSLQGVAGFADGIGPRARFRTPRGVAVSLGGLLAIADTDNHSIRRIQPGGAVTTVAGFGVGKADGPSGVAQFNTPTALTFDTQARIWVGDSNNHAIRRIAADGTVSTVAGALGVPGYMDGDAATARFLQPIGVVFDKSGNLYIADWGNCIIRRLSPAGIVSTIAGKAGDCRSVDGVALSESRFLYPRGLAVDAAGTLYVAEAYNLRVITGIGFGAVTGGIVTTRYRGPNYTGGLAADAQGNVWISEESSRVVRRISTDGVASIFAGVLNDPGPLDTDTFLLDVPAGQPAQVRATAWVAVADSAGKVLAGDCSTQSPPDLTGPAQYKLTVRAGCGGSPPGANYTLTVTATFPPVPVWGSVSASLPSGAGQYQFTATAGNAANPAPSIARPSSVRFWVSGVGVVGEVAWNGVTRVSWMPPPGFNPAVHGVRAQIMAGRTPAGDVTELAPFAVPSSIDAGGVVDTAAFQPAVVRGSLATVFGKELSSGTVQANGVPLPTTLGGVRLTVAGTPAPLLYVSPGQINFQVPFEVGPQGTATVALSRDGVAGPSTTVALTGNAPNIFTYARTVAGVTSLEPVAIHLSGGGLVTPDNPVFAGETLLIFGTGIGDIENPPATGAAAMSPPLPAFKGKATASVGGVAAEVLYAGLAPGFVGLAQFNIVVPTVEATGKVPLVITLGSASGKPVGIWLK